MPGRLLLFVGVLLVVTLSGCIASPDAAVSGPSENAAAEPTVIDASGEIMVGWQTPAVGPVPFVYPSNGKFSEEFEAPTGTRSLSANATWTSPAPVQMRIAFADGAGNVIGDISFPPGETTGTLRVDVADGGTFSFVVAPNTPGANLAWTAQITMAP